MRQRKRARWSAIPEQAPAAAQYDRVDQKTKLVHQGSTVRYLDIEVDAALVMAKHTRKRCIRAGERSLAGQDCYSRR
jgi:hypothetical protein